MIIVKKDADVKHTSQAADNAIVLKRLPALIPVLRGVPFLTCVCKQAVVLVAAVGRKKRYRFFDTAFSCVSLENEVSARETYGF